MWRVLRWIKWCVWVLFWWSSCIPVVNVSWFVTVIRVSLISMLSLRPVQNGQPRASLKSMPVRLPDLLGELSNNQSSSMSAYACIVHFGDIRGVCVCMHASCFLYPWSGLCMSLYSLTYCAVCINQSVILSTYVTEGSPIIWMRLRLMVSSLACLIKCVDINKLCLCEHTCAVIRGYLISIEHGWSEVCLFYKVESEWKDLRKRSIFSWGWGFSLWCDGSLRPAGSQSQERDTHTQSC